MTATVTERDRKFAHTFNAVMLPPQGFILLPMEEEILAQCIADACAEAVREFMGEIEERVRHTSQGQHIFLETPDGEVSRCLRCLLQHPDAPQGCLEQHRDRYIAAERELREERERLRLVTAEYHAEKDRLWAMVDGERERRVRAEQERDANAD